MCDLVVALPTGAPYRETSKTLDAEFSSVVYVSITAAKIWWEGEQGMRRYLYTHGQAALQDESTSDTRCYDGRCSSMSIWERGFATSMAWLGSFIGVKVCEMFCIYQKQAQHTHTHWAKHCQTKHSAATPPWIVEQTLPTPRQRQPSPTCTRLTSSPPPSCRKTSTSSLHPQTPSRPSTSLAAAFASN